MKVPGGGALLAARIDQETSELREIENVLASLPAGPAGPAASTAVRDRFQMLLKDKIWNLREVGNGANDNPDWKTFARALEETRAVKREALAFIQGALLRSSGLDGGVGDVADRLLLGLAERSGITRDVLVSTDVGEFFDHTVSMIRLRFPDTSVWGLPLLAHELGHHAAATLQHHDPRLREQSRPVDAYLRGESEQEAQASGAGRAMVLAYLHELFADVYATYALGTAYPAAVVTLRAWPDNASSSSSTHPSWARRIRMMITTLKAMSDLPDGPPRTEYRLMAEHQIEPLWKQVAGEEPPGDAAAPLVAQQARKMVELLDRHTPERLRYDPSGPINYIAAGLELGAAEVPEGTTMAHVLNAAWLWRLEHWDAERHVTDLVSDNALSFCRLTTP